MGREEGKITCSASSSCLSIFNHRHFKNTRICNLCAVNFVVGVFSTFSQQNREITNIIVGSKSRKDEANPVYLIPAWNALLCPTRKAFVSAVDKACYTYFLVYSLEYNQYYSNFWVCGSNPMVLPFKWKIVSSTFPWYYLFSMYISNFWVCGRTSHGVTIQMKPPQWYFHMVLLNSFFNTQQTKSWHCPQFI